MTAIAPDGRTATAPHALTVAAMNTLPDGGSDMAAASDLSTADDLAGSVDLSSPNDLATPADLASEPDLSSPNDLATSPDLAMALDMSKPLDLTLPADMTTCVPPNIPPTVGPGPNLSITLSNVKLNGGGSFAHVAAGASFTVAAHYSLVDSGGNVDQIIVGINPPNSPLQCLFNAVVPAGGTNGNATITLTAPTILGTYTLRFHYGQANDCSAQSRTTWWSVNGAPTSAEDFAAICVP